MNSRTVTAGAYLLIMVHFSAGAAQAYLDPGTGSIILQGILGTIAVIAVTGRLYWNRIKRFFGLAAKTEVNANKIGNSEEKE